MTARGMSAAAMAVALAGVAQAAPVPVVGCPSDGQTGPIAAPKTGRVPDVPASAARSLAFYRSANDAVLAPRGWHCFGTYGSNGSTLLVTPDATTSSSPDGTPAISGPAVQLSTSIGDTSGRFEVAAIAAVAFPAATPFVAKVEAEGLMDKPLRRRPYPADRLARRGPYQLLFTTAAGQQGLGTRSLLIPGDLPINGVEWLHPQDDMSLTSLAVRLPSDQRPLVAFIIRQVTSARR